MLEIDLALPHSYSVTEPGELPGTGTPSLPVLYFPKPQNRSEHDGLWLRIKGKDGKPWIGVFAYLYNAPPAWSRVIGSLDPDRVCVIARAQVISWIVITPIAGKILPSIPCLIAES